MRLETGMDVRRLGLVVIACLGVLNGCDSQDTARPDKEATVLSKPASPSASQVSLMTGEKDSFHPQSPIESIRKTRLTSFGKLTTEPPVRTPDTETAQRVLDNDEFPKLQINMSESAPIIIPGYPFDFENDMKALGALYDRHNLESVVGDGEADTEILVALMKYTYSFLNDGVMPAGELRWQNGPSAEVITDFREKRGLGGSSEQYSALFCQLALSCGFTARIVGMHTIGDDGEILSHSVCEVYLRKEDKWAVFDPYSRATYYTRDGVPQNALELRNLMLDNLYRAIQPVIGEGDFTEVRDVREDLLPRYRYIYLWRMNDILSRSSRGNFTWQALWEYHLVWEDEKAPVSEGAFDRVEQFTNTGDSAHPLKGVRFVTHDEKDFYWPLYHMEVNLSRTSSSQILYYLDTLTPNFKNFLVVNKEVGESTVVTGNTYTQNIITQELLIVVLDQFESVKIGTTLTYQ